tara:strand:- start:149 stop:349 length:201 start_codon:yes stop_codon:yes gene_type:complete
MSGATASDFNRWRDLASIVSLDSLKYIIEDCAAARDAMRGWNPVKENYYADMYFTYSDELYRRGQV